MKIVIITRNQLRTLKPTLKSLSNYKDDIVVVCDRCKDKTVEYLQKNNYNYIDLKSKCPSSYRKTSTARNAGAAYWKGHDILFLDGDRAIVEGTIEYLPDVTTDIALLLVKDDFRLKAPCLFYGTVDSHFYSAGVFIKKEALQRIDTRFGEIFPVAFQTTWGYEDVVLGDMCYSLGLTCDFYKHCRLKGCFENKLRDPEVFIKRLVFRETLGLKNSSSIKTVIIND